MLRMMRYWAKAMVFVVLEILGDVDISNGPTLLTTAIRFGSTTIKARKHRDKATDVDGLVGDQKSTRGLEEVEVGTNTGGAG